MAPHIFGKSPPCYLPPLTSLEPSCSSYYLWFWSYNDDLGAFLPYTSIHEIH